MLRDFAVWLLYKTEFWWGLMGNNMDRAFAFTMLMLIITLWMLPGALLWYWLGAWAVGCYGAGAIMTGVVIWISQP